MSVVRHILRISPPHGSCSVVQAEDWQSDKCDVYMSEAHPVSYVLGVLDEAHNWVRSSSNGEQVVAVFTALGSNTTSVKPYWKNALFIRLNLRKVGSKIYFIVHDPN